MRKLNLVLLLILVPITSFATQTQRVLIGYSLVKIDIYEISHQAEVWGIITKKEAMTKPWTWIQLLPANESVASYFDDNLDKSKTYLCNISGVDNAWAGPPPRATRIVYQIYGCTEN